MSTPVPAPRRRSRRDSVLDIGGPNSINNFVGSINRSTSFGQFSVDYHPEDFADSASIPAFDDTYASEDFPVFDEEASLLSHNPAASTTAQQVFHPGGSTVYQTIFNAINVLVGMGILSLPLGFKLSGWVLGVFLLTLGPLTTRYTALLLGRILARHPQLRSYSDIGQYCLSKSCYSVLVFTFIVDLYGASLTLVLLFADSFSTISSIHPDNLKAFSCISLFALSFLPLAILSFLSVAGIASVTCIIAALGVAGFTKSDSPGSIFETMPTDLWPESYLGLLVAIGIFMAPWGGHVVFPELFRDMRHPHKYPQAVTSSYSFAYSIDIFTATFGYLMFGSLVLPEITNNILLTAGYPAWLQTLITLCMGLLPLAKLPLFILPVVKFFEQCSGKGSYRRIVVRILVTFSLFICSKYIVDFGKVMSVMGALICISTCVTAPLLFYLLTFKDELPRFSQLGLIAGIALSSLVSILGTISGIVADI